MAKKKGNIVVKISPDGSKVDIDQLGFHGAACEEACKELFDAIGKITYQKKKPEYYSRKKDVHIDTHI